MNNRPLIGVIVTLIMSIVVSGAFAQSTTAVQAQKLIAVPDTNADNEMAYLDLLAEALRKSPNSRGYVIGYSKPGLPPGNLLMRLYGYRDYLVNARGVEPNRVNVIAGGVKDTLYTDLWLVPNEADAPKPDSEMRVIAKSALLFDVVYPDCPPEMTVYLYELKDSLKFYAQALKENPNTRARIVVYSGKRRGLKSTGMAKEVQALLEKGQAINGARIVTAASGRRRACSEIELWLMPQTAISNATQSRPANGRDLTDQGTRSATKVGRYTLQSNPWVNLHQRLMYEVRFKGATPAALSGDDLTKWKMAVEAYRMFLGKRSPIFDDELKQMNATLSKTSTFRLPGSIPEAAGKALEAAMPLYRSVQWEEDDRANRFCIAVVEPMLRLAGEELVEAHEKAYGMPFPKHILVDVAAFGWEFGAYTVGAGDSAHVVIQSIDDPANQGFMALESLMHEPSHAIVGPTSGAIGADLTRIAKELGLKPRYNLWHAILFYTSGELTRRALAKRGVLNYQRIIDAGMYERGFQGFKQPLETHWQAYLDGKVSRDAAIRQILIETTPTKK